MQMQWAGIYIDIDIDARFNNGRIGAVTHQ